MTVAELEAVEAGPGEDVDQDAEPQSVFTGDQGRFWPG